jgi:hypothetical protein
VSFGATTAWARWFASPKKVYVWRTGIRGAKIETPTDAHWLLRAVAKGQILRLDTRGIVLGRAPDGTQTVDVVMTADTTIPYFVPQSAVRVAEAAAGDGPLRQRFPALVFESPQFLTLTGPAPAVDFWRQLSIAWDDTVGPTEVFADEAAAYRGAGADAGAQLEQWLRAKDPLEPADKPAKPAATNFLAWAAAGAVVIWAGAHIISTKEQAA